MLLLASFFSRIDARARARASDRQIALNGDGSEKRHARAIHARVTAFVRRGYDEINSDMAAFYDRSEVRSTRSWTSKLDSTPLFAFCRRLCKKQRIGAH